MKSVFRSFLTISLIFGSMVSLWLLVANLEPLQPALYTLMLLIFVGLYMAIRVYDNSFLVWFKKFISGITKKKHFVITTLFVTSVIGLSIRLFFYFRFSYAPISDPMTFFDSAKALAAGGGLLGNDYVAFHPYLAAYNNLLGLAMKLISDPWLTTILLNAFLDILSSLLVYVLIRKILGRSSHLPVLAFAVWMMSPLNIIFSVLSLPIIVVNFFVILCMLISYLLLKRVFYLDVKKSFLLSIALGFVLGIGNTFRPVFTVVLIALAIMFMYVCLTSKSVTKAIKLSVGCLILSSAIFVAIQQLSLTLVSNQTGLQAARNPSGWSMYVGSTWESYGEWRAYHNDERRLICAASIARNDFDECHSELRNRAISRYKDYGVAMSASLLIIKLHNQSSDQNYFYNAEQSLVGYEKSKTSKLINVYSILYLIVLFGLSAKFLYTKARMSAKNRQIEIEIVLLTLMMIGWFFSMMLVESAPRYSTILYPALTVFSVLALDKKYSIKTSLRKRRVEG